MKDVIRIEGLTKNYGKHRGVEDVSFCVSEGDIFGFLPSDGLQDNVHINIIFCQQIKQLKGNTRLILKAHNRNSGRMGIQGYTTD